MATAGSDPWPRARRGDTRAVGAECEREDHSADAGKYAAAGKRRSFEGRCHGLALPRRTLDSRDNPVVSPTTADVAIHVGDDLVPGRLRIARQQFCRLHDLPRLAITALRYCFSYPGFLQRMRGIRR